jgi:hypothetical protein
VTGFALRVLLFVFPAALQVINGSGYGGPVGGVQVMQANAHIVGIAFLVNQVFGHFHYRFVFA